MWATATTTTPARRAHHQISCAVKWRANEQNTNAGKRWCDVMRVSHIDSRIPYAYVKLRANTKRMIRLGSYASSGEILWNGQCVMRWCECDSESEYCGSRVLPSAIWCCTILDIFTGTVHLWQWAIHSNGTCFNLTSYLYEIATLVDENVNGYPGLFRSISFPFIITWKILISPMLIDEPKMTWWCRNLIYRKQSGIHADSMKLFYFWNKSIENHFLFFNSILIFNKA